MTYNHATDGARIVAIFLDLVLIVQLWHAIRTNRWPASVGVAGLLQFVTLLLVWLFLGLIEKLVIDAKPAISPFGLCFVFCFGIWVLTEPSRANRISAKVLRAVRRT